MRAFRLVLNKNLVPYGYNLKWLITQWITIRFCSVTVTLVSPCLNNSEEYAKGSAWNRIFVTRLHGMTLVIRQCLAQTVCWVWSCFFSFMKVFWHSKDYINLDYLQTFLPCHAIWIDIDITWLNWSIMSQSINLFIIIVLILHKLEII